MTAGSAPGTKTISTADSRMMSRAAADRRLPTAGCGERDPAGQPRGRNGIERYPQCLQRRRCLDEQQVRLGVGQQPRLVAVVALARSLPREESAVASSGVSSSAGQARRRPAAGVAR